MRAKAITFSELLAKLPARIAKKILVMPSGCWEWQGWRVPKGYGQVCVDSKMVSVHRHIWAVVNGPIQGGLFVLHECDNPPCCNSGHLFLGTGTDNMRDMASKGRSANAVLTHADVVEMRAAYASGGVTQYELAATYGVSQQAANDAIRGKSYGPAPDYIGRVKLSAATIDEIRAAYGAGGVLQRELAVRYSVSQATVHNAVSGKLQGAET